MTSTLVNLGLAALVLLAIWGGVFVWVRYQRYAHNGYGRVPLLPKSLPKTLRRALGERPCDPTV